MNKILKLIINDYQNQKPSAEYQLTLHRYCDAEQGFMSTLSKKQKVEYMKLDFLVGELSVVEQDEFAKYLFEFKNRL